MDQSNTPDLFSGVLPREYSRRAKENLTAAARACDDPKLARMLLDAAEGKISLRDLVERPEIRELASQGLQKYEKYRASMSDEERAKADEDAAASAQEQITSLMRFRGLEG